MRGQVASNNFAFTPNLWPDPTVALIDVTNVLRGQPEVLIQEEGQILGLLTASLFPGPGQLQVNLPIAPTGQTLD